MKKILISFLLIFPLLYSCEKDSKDISRVTYYANLNLTGSYVVVKLGDTYVEPGYVATENNVDITSKVVVSGTVNTAVPGAYTLTYSVDNKDGFAKTATRIVIVAPNGLSTADISGVYTGQRVGKAASLHACSITKLAEGVFFATDLFGGYYNFIAKYGPAYSMNTYFYLNADNTYVSLWNDTPWGPWEIQNGVYNPGTGVMTHRVYQDGFGFNVILTKEAK